MTNDPIEVLGSFIGRSGCVCMFGLSENLRVNHKCQYHAALEQVKAERERLQERLRAAKRQKRRAVRSAKNNAEQAEKFRQERDRYKAALEQAKAERGEYVTIWALQTGTPIAVYAEDVEELVERVERYEAALEDIDRGFDLNGEPIHSAQMYARAALAERTPEDD